MNFDINKENYNKFLNYLYEFQDLKYREFHKKLILNDKLIGIRTPELKRIARQISKNNYKSFFKSNKHELYEENLLHGLVLGYLNLDFKTIKFYIDEFIPYIDNWAVCDMTVSNLKVFKKKKNKDMCFNEIKKYLVNNNPWINRFGYILLLTYYIDNEHIDKIFELCENFKNQYYVKMAVAWLISMCYIKYKDKTLEFLKNNKLDDWTYNKSIQKIIESNRVTIEDKKMLKKLKRK